MGAASYNRGTRAIRRQADEAIAQAVRNQETRHKGEPTMRINLFQNTVIRRYDVGGEVYLMNRPDRGFAETAIPFPSVDAIVARYAVTVGEWTTDQFGDVAPVTIDPPATLPEYVNAETAYGKTVRLSRSIRVF